MDEIIERVTEFMDSRILDFYDKIVEEKATDVITEFLEDNCDYDEAEKAEGTIPKNWEDNIMDYVDSSVSVYNNELLDWAVETNFRGVDFTFEELGTKYEIEDSSDIYKMLMQAQFICIEKIVVNTIEEAIYNKILRESLKY